MKRLVLIGFLATACTPVAPLPGPPQGKCDTAALGNLIGRVATPMLVNRAQHRARASMARILRPGQIVTMEYRADRLTVHLDKDGRVERFICG